MSDLLWTGFGLVEPMGARVFGTLPAGVSGISIDTRTLAPGDLFVAIKGDSSDGHDHVAKAFEKGAAACVVDEAHFDALRDHGPLYVVDDTLASLQGLGLAARARTDARIIAVTGSVGKTSTKEALRVVLASVGRTHASVASYNNHWGVPLTLARMPKDTEFGVFEIGMNHAGEIEPLVAMVRPHVAVITTVAAVHLEFFSSVADIADAKAEIFTGLEPGGTAIINRDIDTYYRLAMRAEHSPAGRILSFGQHPEADARLDQIRLEQDGSAVEASISGQPLAFRLGAPGKHLAVNALAVLLAAEAVGIQPFMAGLALGGYTAGAGRGERVTLMSPTGPFTLIDESYNANPTSMRAAIALLADASVGPEGRRIAVLGEMREMGPDAAKLHEGLGPDLRAAGTNLLFAAGPLTRPLFDSMPTEAQGLWTDRSAAIQAPLAAAIRGGDVVMVKGSKSSLMAPLVAALKAQFAPDGDKAASDAAEAGMA